MKRFPIALAVAAFTLTAASGAFATGIKIEGNVSQNVTSEYNTNTALGNDSVARQAFGVIDANVSGTVTQSVNAYQNTNTAEGKVIEGVPMVFVNGRESFFIDGMQVGPFTVPHDAREPVQYVRMQGIDRKTTWGYSIWEFGIYAAG